MIAGIIHASEEDTDFSISQGYANIGKFPDASAASAVTSLGY
jgi:hypothetical protein